MGRCMCKGQDLVHGRVMVMVRVNARHKSKNKGKGRARIRGFSQGVKKGETVHRWCWRVGRGRGQTRQVITGKG
jgi:hypothetical protein